MLKLWGRTNSINVQKVVWTLEELGMEYERIDAGMQYGGVNEAWYRNMNPNGRIPTIDDDGFVLWESNAIVRYLAAKYGAGTLCPEQLQTRADADRWMDWCTTTLAPTISTVFWGLIRTAPEKRDNKAIEEARAKAQEAMAILDTHLAGKPYVAGAALTMGDIPLGCFVERWYALPIERPACAHLAAWHQRLQQRPAFKKSVMLPLS